MDRFSNSSLSHSSESSGDTHFRIQPIPENVSPFRLAELSNTVNANNQAMNLSCKKEKNELAMQVNCTSNGTLLHLQLQELQDILKDAKTSNVNVLVEEQEANNTIRFDSDKFPRHDSAKARELPNPNLLETYDFDSKSVSVKRIKDTNLTQEQRDGENAESRGLDLKRIKLTEQNNCRREHINSLLEENDSVGHSVVDNVKQTNSDIQLSFTNGVGVHNEEGQLAESSTSSQITDVDDCLTLESFPENTGSSAHRINGNGIHLKEDLLADQHWEKHLAANQSTIADTFLGQFKSTVIRAICLPVLLRVYFIFYNQYFLGVFQVVCSECKHVSVTYEPFMYLSVPLPHAMERQISKYRKTRDLV